uniref:HAT C-terminal dimerisation domain-containing protein n=1 Tax=Globodera rostochiensis TaxID=31243 RepID=A0A914IBH2_GLORO
MEKHENKRFLVIATLIDPRYKNHQNIFSYEDRIQNKVLLQMEIELFINPQRRVSDSEATLNYEPLPTQSDNPLSNFLFPTSCGSVDSTQSQNDLSNVIINEIDSFFKSPTIEYDADPLVYWRGNSTYPNIKQIVSKYLAPPPGTVESERTFKSSNNDAEIKGACWTRNSRIWPRKSRNDLLDKELKELAKENKGLLDKEFKDLAKEIKGLLDKEFKDLANEIKGLLDKEIKDLAKEIKGLVDKELAKEIKGLLDKEIKGLWPQKKITDRFAEGNQGADGQGFQGLGQGKQGPGPVKLIKEFDKFGGAFSVKLVAAELRPIVGNCVSGSPHRAISDFNFEIVAVLFVELISNISGYLEYASTIMSIGESFSLDFSRRQHMRNILEEGFNFRIQLWPFCSAGVNDLEKCETALMRSSANVWDRTPPMPCCDTSAAKMIGRDGS